MSLISPDDFTLHRHSVLDDDAEYGRLLARPISYFIRLRPPAEQFADESLWPADANLALRIPYPRAYCVHAAREFFEGPDG